MASMTKSLDLEEISNLDLMPTYKLWEKRLMEGKLGAVVAIEPKTGSDLSDGFFSTLIHVL